MSTATTVSEMVHLLFAGVWSGSVLFFAGGVLPVARAELTGRVLDRFVWVSRVSSLLLLTGGHLAGARYGDGRLTGTSSGGLVLAMVALWLAMTAAIEVANARSEDGRVGTTATRLFQFAGLLALLLLVDAGLLSTGGF